MENLLHGKKILVAGANGLLGCSLIPLLLKQGASVIATDIDLDQMSERFGKKGINSNRLELFQLDVTDEEQVKRIFSRCEGLSGAVNATYPRNSSYGAHFFDVSMSCFNENLSLHLGSAFLFSQQSAAYFQKKNLPFSLVNVASIYGVVAPKFEIYNNTSMTVPVEYAAIKSALLHLNKYIVAYIKDSRFRINCISPGGIFDHQQDCFLDAYKKQTHGAGMLDVSEVTGSILFLLSDQARYITGQNIIIDDGFSI
jgi:NAD(P)-dependent dehydrogenase (short-subunit alcohol dehydrogenase family)